MTLHNITQLDYLEFFSLDIAKVKKNIFFFESKFKITPNVHVRMAHEKN